MNFHQTRKNKDELLLISVVLILEIILFFVSKVRRGCNDVASAIVYT